MTHRFVKFGFAGIAASLSLGSLLTGCGGGGVDQDYLDSSSRALIGTYSKTSISALGTRVTCGDASSVVGDPKTELKDRNVVIDVCTPTDTITFSEDGRYAIKSYGGTEAGTFTRDNQRLELVRDTENGSVLSTPYQKTVYTLSGSGTDLVFTPTAQPVGYQKIDPAGDAFNGDNTPNYDNLAPKANVDGTLAILWLPNADSKPVLKSNLSIVPELIADAKEAVDARGFSKRYVVTYTFGKK